jgi:hypothetical protein
MSHGKKYKILNSRADCLHTDRCTGSDPPPPQATGYRLRGVSISMIPINLVYGSSHLERPRILRVVLIPGVSSSS